MKQVGILEQIAGMLEGKKYAKYNFPHNFNSAIDNHCYLEAVILTEQLILDVGLAFFNIQDTKDHAQNTRPMIEVWSAKKFISDTEKSKLHKFMDLRNEMAHKVMLNPKHYKKNDVDEQCQEIIDLMGDIVERFFVYFFSISRISEMFALIQIYDGIYKEIVVVPKQPIIVMTSEPARQTIKAMVKTIPLETWEKYSNQWSRIKSAVEDGR